MRIGFNYHINHSAFPENLCIAHSFIQPILENAIKHGITGRKNGEGKITVNISQPYKNMVRCEIIDNGQGYRVSDTMKKNKNMQSMGLTIIRERLKIYSSLLRRDLKLVISPCENGVRFQGTKVTIDIPAKIME